MTTVRSAVLAISDLDEGAEINVHTEPSTNAEMKHRMGFKGLFARNDIKAGSVILHLKGSVSTRPNMYSIQLGKDKHLDFPPVRKPDDDLDYAWQYLNHSCEPNGYVNAAEYTFCAVRDIKEGEEITFNYLATEDELSSPFQCQCGSAKCYGLIRGNKFLTAEQKAELEQLGK